MTEPNAKTAAHQSPMDVSYAMTVESHTPSSQATPKNSSPDTTTTTTSHSAQTPPTTPPETNGHSMINPTFEKTYRLAWEKSTKNYDVYSDTDGNLGKIYFPKSELNQSEAPMTMTVTVAF